MKTEVMDFVVKATANQLGIKEEQVTLETIIPDIHSMAMSAVINLCRVVTITDIQGRYTVERAIKEFEQ